MSFLLDTHALLWWMLDDERLSPAARETIADVDNELVWSVVGTWEIAIKAGLGRIDLPGSLADLLGTTLRAQAIAILPIHQAHALRVERLPAHHRDPFDRMLVAQAVEEDLVVVSKDTALAAYDVEVLW